MRLLTIVGARPQFVKAAMFSKALAKIGVTETLVHTGQHYDYDMSEVFFKELSIPKPAYNLGIGGKSHGSMTGQMLEKLEEVMVSEKPDAVVVFGDTNSTLAGALAASKLGIHLTHIEAGLRSYNREMPEEINRVVTDHLSNSLFCSSQTGATNLNVEGVSTNVHVVGDVMADASKFARKIVSTKLNEYLPKDVTDLTQSPFAVLTLHRAENTDAPERLSRIVSELNQTQTPIIFPVHPRTLAALERNNLTLKNHVRTITPIGYLAITALLMKAHCVVTDSGGLQKEAYWAEVPCITLRTETEWTETIDEGWNQLVIDSKSITELFAAVQKPTTAPLAYGGGDSSDKIAKILLSQLKS